MILKVVSVLLILLPALLTIPSDLMQKEAVLFSDDFSDGNDNGWGPKIGEWVVVDGEYTALGTSGTPMSQASVGPVLDFVFKGDLRITQEGAAQVAVRLQSLRSTSVSDLGDGVLLVIFPGGNSIYWHVIRNGVGAPQYIRPLGTAVDGNHPLHVEVKVQGNSYEAYVNEVLTNTLVDGTFTSGYVAIGVNLNYPTPTRWDNILISTTEPSSRAVLALESGTEGQLHVGEERQLRLEVLNLNNRTVTYSVRAFSDSVQLIGPSEVLVRIDALSSRQVTFGYRATETGARTIMVTVYEGSAAISQSGYTISVLPNPWYLYVFISAIIGGVVSYFINKTMGRSTHRLKR
jgi:hypothetical protein